MRKIEKIYGSDFMKLSDITNLMKRIQPNQYLSKPLFKYLLVLLFSFSYMTASAIEVEAGEDKVGCTGEEIEIGGDPTAGPDSMGPFKYEWTNSKGEVISTEANPTIVVGDKEETYTVTVEDKDGFKCDDFMKVELIEIGDITFAPLESLPADGSSTTTASAEIKPTGRTIKWEIEGDALGCTINESSGLITAGEKKGYIKVRAYDSEERDINDLCYNEAELCIGDECCPTISGTRTFGPLTFEVNELKAKDKDEDDFCIYELVGASLSLKTKGKLDRDESVNGVTVKWKEKTKDDGTYEFSGVEVTWEGKEKTREVGIFEAELKKIALSVSSSGALGGEITFDINQTKDKTFKGIAVVKKGTSGTFTYKYKSQNSFEGEFDFGGINNVVINLEKSRKKLASITGSMTKEGKLNARLRVEANAVKDFSSKGFTAKLKELDLGVQLDIAELEGSFTGGTGKVEISNVANVKGKFELGLQFSSTTVTASAEMKGAEAFGCKMDGTIAADFGYDFELNWIDGSNINAKHPELDQKFQGVGFRAELGKLKRFDIRFVEVKYKNGIKFSIANGKFVEGKGLELDAKATAGGLKLEVTDLKIDSEGKITFGKGIVNYVNPPLTSIVGEATLTGSRFTGTYEGRVKGGISIDGSIVIGAEPTYNYGFLSAGLKVQTGVLLGSSGLKMNKLLGEVGVNWNPGASFDGTGGSPSNGTYVFGAGVGITDAFFDIILLEGKGRVILGTDNGFGILGAVKVPADPPHYFNSNLGVTYFFGKEEIDVSIESTFKVPPVNGGIIKIESGPINFKTRDATWSLKGTGMNGKVFDVVEFSGSIDVGAPMRYLSQLRGTASGSLKVEKTFDYRYPDDFDPTNCQTADDTDNLIGFGVQGTLKAKLEGSASADFSPSGFDGAIELGVSGSNKMFYKFPCIVVCGDDCLKDSDLSISGKLKIENAGSQIRIYGKGKFSDGNETEEGEIDVVL